MLILKKAKSTNMCQLVLEKKMISKDLDLPVSGLNPTWEIPFSEKDCQYLPSWCSRALVYNNVEGSNLGMAIDGDAKKFHLSSFQNAMGEAHKAGSYKVVFNNTMANRPS